jgi:hypothetical protein
LCEHGRSVVDNGPASAPPMAPPTATAPTPAPALTRNRRLLNRMPAPRSPTDPISKSPFDRRWFRRGSVRAAGVREEQSFDSGAEGAPARSTTCVTSRSSPPKPPNGGIPQEFGRGKVTSNGVSPRAS